MSKIVNFLKDTWSEYIDFMGKYGVYIDRNEKLITFDY